MTTGSITSASNHELSPSCGWAGNDPTTAVGHYPEQAYQFSVTNATALNPCTVTVTFTGTSLLLLEGSDCSGPEVACQSADPSGSTSFTFNDSRDVGDYVLVLENDFSFGGTVDYTIVYTCD